jgi:hypothetical protein
MVVAAPTRKFCFPIVATFISMLLLLAACGANGNTNSTASTPSSASTSTGNTNATSIATATSMMKLVSLIGQPKVWMLSGTSFEADGQLKNNDTNQHDFTLKITLLDASGKVIATTTQLIDNVKGGETVGYAIQGTTTQPGWSSVEVAVIKVSENINGSGSD